MPPQVREALQGQMINHRGREFGALIHEVTEGVQHFFQTTNDLLILTGSGTGAMEAAIVNMLSPNEHVLAVSIGNFGDRFAAIARAFGVRVTKVDFPGGKAAILQSVGARDPHVERSRPFAGPPSNR